MKDSAEIASELRPVLTRLVRKLRKLSPSDNLLSQSERAVLVLLDQNGQLLASELAVMEKITPQSIGQLLSHLASLNLISRTGSPDDRRKIIISLSDEGKAMLQKVRNERNEWLSKAISQVCTEKEKMTLMEAIIPLTKLVDVE